MAIGRMYHLYGAVADSVGAALTASTRSILRRECHLLCDLNKEFAALRLLHKVVGVRLDKVQLRCPPWGARWTRHRKTARGQRTENAAAIEMP